LSQSARDVVTRVKLKETVDHVLAVGYSSGAVYIFQLPNDMQAMSEQVITALQ